MHGSSPTAQPCSHPSKGGCVILAEKKEKKVQLLKAKTTGWRPISRYQNQKKRRVFVFQGPRVGHFIVCHIRPS